LDPIVVAQIINQVPAILVIALVAAFGFRYRTQIGSFLTSRSHIKVAAGPWALEVDGSDLQRELAVARPEQPTDPAVGDELARRVAELVPIIRRASILWVDDDPSATLPERRILHELGFFVNPVASTADAIAALRTGVAGHPYDLLISDMSRHGNDEAGVDMLKSLREAGLVVPVVFYVLRLREGTPPGSFGITNRPDDLMRLVLDVIERRAIAPRPA
jgi:CheY-like chemotaxis protein